MLFSIIVPIYKVEEYLEKCVASLRNQTYKDIEIILVDDGSPDRCPELCDRYGEEDPRIRVLHKENGGLSDARNAGMEIARGEYLVFVDSDDYIEEDTCQRFAALAEEGHDILVGDAVLEGGCANIAHLPPREQIFSGKEYLLTALEAQRAPMAAWLNVYRRAFLEKHGLLFKVGRLHEDEEFTPRALLAAESVVLTGITFYHYIIRGGSITTQKDQRKNAQSLFATCQELREIYLGLEDKRLKKLLLDSLAEKYLSMIRSADLVQYGKEYYHKGFLLKNAKKPKTRLKAWLFAASPRVYRVLYNRKNKNSETKEG